MKELINEMSQCGEGTFSPKIDGVTYGFAVFADGKCEIFDTAEVDDYRIEKFDSAEDALKGFMVGAKPLSDYADCLSVKPCLSI